MDKTDQIGQIISLIFNVRHLLHEKLCCKHDKKMSFLHMATLLYIKKKGPLMKDIAGHLDITPPSATSLVNNLLREGMVERVLSHNDRRIVNIAITKKGEMYLKEGQNAMRERMRKSLEQLTREEQKQLEKILGKIVEAYKK